MSKAVTSVDLGYMYTKGIINGKPIMIKSVVGVGKDRKLKEFNKSVTDSFALDNKHDDIEYRDAQGVHFVSDLAITQSRIVKHSLTSDRFDSEVTKVLLGTILGLGMNSGAKETNFVSGLPVSHFDQYKEAIKSLFLDTKYEYSIESSGVRMNGSVKGRKGLFVPQPFGALMDRILDDKGEIADTNLAKSRVAVVDIGFGTTDIYVCEVFNNIEHLTTSFSVAMNSVNQVVSDSILDHTGVNFPLYKAEHIVQSRVLKSGTKVYDMSPTIDWAYENVAYDITNRLHNFWKDEIKFLDKIIFAGGGGASLYPHMKDHFPNTELSESGQFAVARGYNKWGIRNLIRGV